ncbi:hypothetical protein DYB36_009818 [Aphanomyces astaci]|uniref:Retroviral polymerase SH3-like domain-containing protein n=1 Tax=Aphanomyces astaci TaxID=112090 RepID=A0A397A071_APHAT|nr:hypothetical protein DYB36_009818 [Aphanomyces astaci]
MTEKYNIDSTTKLKADGANYREWCLKNRAKTNQQHLSKYLERCTINGRFIVGHTEEDDLAAGSYMLLTIHPDHLKYVQAATMTPDNRHVGSRLSNLRKRIRETEDARSKDGSQSKLDQRRLDDKHATATTAARLVTLPQSAVTNKVTSRGEPSADRHVTKQSPATKLGRGDRGRGPGNGDRVGRGRHGRHTVHGRRGGRPNWYEQDNYANEDEKDYNEDVFTVELIEHAVVYRALNEPGTDDKDEWELVSNELAQYAERTDLDQYNNIHSWAASASAVSDKTSARANKCLCLDYNETKKAYKVYDLEEKKIVFTLDCRVEETEFLQLRALPTTNEIRQ